MGKILTAAKTASRNPARDYCALLLMFRHGLRVSELCSIKLSDINVQTKEFHVNRLKDCDSGPHELYNGEPAAVKAWLVERAKMKVPADCDTLFVSERRKPLSRVTVWHMVGEIAKVAGLAHLRPHPCRRRSRAIRAQVRPRGAGVTSCTRELLAVPSR
jgi:type 1 fimbriae regulatory protein FimB